MNQMTTLAPGMTGPLGFVGAASDAYGVAEVPGWLVVGNFTIFVLWFLLLGWWLIYTTVCAEHRASRLAPFTRSAAPTGTNEAVPHVARAPARESPDTDG
jgi:hypothetical protein